LKRDQRNEGIQKTIEKQENTKKTDERFSSPHNERFSTTKNALDGIEENIFKKQR
jgi:hypothetical protein